jgi:hypothetical protein
MFVISSTRPPSGLPLSSTGPAPSSLNPRNVVEPPAKKRSGSGIESLSA